MIPDSMILYVYLDYHIRCTLAPYWFKKKILYGELKPGLSSSRYTESTAIR